MSSFDSSDSQTTNLLPQVRSRSPSDSTSLVNKPDHVMDYVAEDLSRKRAAGMTSSAACKPVPITLGGVEHDERRAEQPLSAVCGAAELTSLTVVPTEGAIPLLDDDGKELPLTVWKASERETESREFWIPANIPAVFNAEVRVPGLPADAPVKVSVSIAVGELEYRAAKTTVTPLGPERVKVTITSDGPLSDRLGVYAVQVKLEKVAIQGYTIKPAEERVARATALVTFGPPLEDNVTESKLLPPGTSGDDAITRIKPMFCVSHVRQACEWAQNTKYLKGGSEDDQDNIVLTVVRKVPHLDYGEASQYCETNDGWNVWDNSTMRTADCSQLASFLADVLGTLGVRAHDMELKFDVTWNRKRYRKAFGSDPNELWPCHGVLLVNYTDGGYWCYDTTFSYPEPRIAVRLEEAVRAGAKVPFIKPGWVEWWQLTEDGATDVTPAKHKQLNKKFPHRVFASMMRDLAAKKFPDSKRQ